MIDLYRNIKVTDKELYDALTSEINRQEYTLELIASEKFC